MKKCIIVNNNNKLSSCFTFPIIKEKVCICKILENESEVNPTFGQVI